MRSTALKLIGTVLTAIGAAALLLPGTAGAHAGDQSYLYIDITTDALGGRVEMPLADLQAVFGYRLDGPPDAVLDELRSEAEEIGAYVRDHLSVGAAGVTWPLDVTTIELLTAEGGYAQVYFLADVGTDEIPRRLEVTFDPFFDEIPGRDALILIGNDWHGGVIDNGEEVLVGVDFDERRRVIDLGDASQLKNFTASIEIGIDHIRTGPDHILFVLVLMLPSVLIFSIAWRPAPSFGSSLWRILKIVSMFTVAHSITFVLAGLEVLPLPPSRVVETLIAASIAVTALHNLHPVAINREWAIAFAFGLFHGMGFATLLSGLDVSDGTKLVSLLGRNVGIEIGQAIVVIMVFPALFLLRRTRWYRPIFVVGSIGLAIVASGWMIERLFQRDLRVARAVEPLVEFPRSLIVVGVVTALAAAVHLTEERAGRLLPAAGALDTAVGPEREEVLTGSSDGPR